MPPSYGLFPPSYGLLPTPYGLLPPSYGLLPPSYGLLPPSYGLLPPSYGLLPPLYGLLPHSYGLSPRTNGLSTPPEPRRFARGSGPGVAPVSVVVVRLLVEGGQVSCRLGVHVAGRPSGLAVPVDTATPSKRGACGRSMTTYRKGEDVTDGAIPARRVALVADAGIQGVSPRPHPGTTASLSLLRDLCVSVVRFLGWAEVGFGTRRAR